jgi:hypothetical protein
LVDRDRQLLVGLARTMRKRMDLWSLVEEKHKPGKNSRANRSGQTPMPNRRLCTTISPQNQGRAKDR